MTERYKVLKDIMNKRRATRSYIDGKKIPNEDLALIFEATNTSPSSLGLENWRVINIRSEELKEKVSEFFFGNNKISAKRCSDIVFYITSKEKNFTFDNENLREVIERNHKKINKESNDYEEKVKKAIDELGSNVGKKNQCNPASGNVNSLEEWSSRQAYIAIMSMMLSAESLDINSTPTEGYSFELNNFFREKEMMSKYEKISVAAFLGYVNKEKDKNFGKEQIRLNILKKFKNY